MKLYQAIGHWSSTTLGTYGDGEIFLIDDSNIADNMVKRGYIREYEVKPHPVQPKKPLPADDATSSPAAQPAQKPKKSKPLKTKAQ